MIAINERSSARATITFRDFAGVPATPVSVTVRIDCVTTGTAIRAATTVPPASSVIVDITPTENRIVTAANHSEIRRVTVIATYGATDQITAQTDYSITNLSPGVT